MHRAPKPYACSLVGLKLTGEAAGRRGAPAELANESSVGRGVPAPGCWLFACAFMTERGSGQHSRAPETKEIPEKHWLYLPLPSGTGTHSVLKLSGHSLNWRAAGEGL